MVNTFRHASAVLHQDADAKRLRFHTEKAIEDLFPILKALEDHASEEDIPIPWFHECREVVGELVVGLCEAQEKALERQEESKVRFVKPAKVVRAGKRGRPRKGTNVGFVAEAMASHRRISVTKLAKILGVNKPTLITHLKANGVYSNFTSLSKSELDTLRRAIKRKPCKVSRPHALWHVDSHQKLTSWGNVIHGFVDNCSRTITGLRASTNNRAATVLSADRTFEI
ncbi:hypothetical protein B0H16DRAFT_1438837 [Mycena metata]|uniref:Integrase core domain-containing protein n=1 Tax=Mycena metata TaxID=1033252 RepID=A0AAD7M9N9_9AGAR|nr:hypothetical protein B0H16DRAFT_1438837 [Mycena metata]